MDGGSSEHSIAGASSSTVTGVGREYYYIYLFWDTGREYIDVVDRASTLYYRLVRQLLKIVGELGEPVIRETRLRSQILGRITQLLREYLRPFPLKGYAEPDIMVTLYSRDRGKWVVVSTGSFRV